ncbi:hypothetical protein B0T26DRAFT_25906 [Lasiosphaeria miniovina]|uniref:Uncharacterized protein n=1 Tax=Lasiosphaeria miniovina TaxID=1954250 RepID=A0AA40BFZ7_9PEZI|nr:uncharacterized protein B0T26DRAFT_25906 [Lasiosphaeria miniovina]KAK0733545.1 hypothetical protein B0T26DRAFT_25906 [Lasiosphaeria miniovina]
MPHDQIGWIQSASGGRGKKGRKKHQSRLLHDPRPSSTPSNCHSIAAGERCGFPSQLPEPGKLMAIYRGFWRDPSSPIKSQDSHATGLEYTAEPAVTIFQTAISSNLQRTAEISLNFLIVSFHRPNWALDAGSRSLGFDPSLKNISARSCLASHIGHVCTAQCIPTDVHAKPGLGVLPAQRVLGYNMHAFLLGNQPQLFGIVGSVGQTSRHLCPQLRCSYSGAASTFVATCQHVICQPLEYV